MQYVVLENVKSKIVPLDVLTFTACFLLLSSKWILTEGYVWVKSKYNPESKFFPLVSCSLLYCERRGAPGPVLSVLLVGNDCCVRRAGAVTVHPSLE